MKKTLSVFLLIAMLSGMVMFGCQNNEVNTPDTGTTIEETTIEVVEETTVEGEGVIAPPLPSSEELDGEYFDWKDGQEGADRQTKKGGKKFFGKR